MRKTLNLPTKSNWIVVMLLELYIGSFFHKMMENNMLSLQVLTISFSCWMEVNRLIFYSISIRIAVNKYMFLFRYKKLLFLKIKFLLWIFAIRREDPIPFYGIIMEIWNTFIYQINIQICWIFFKIQRIYFMPLVVTPISNKLQILPLVLVKYVILGLTEYHYFVLYKEQLFIYSTISEKLV
jgi:hypothetical protein